MNNDEPVEIEGHYVTHTDEAILILADTGDVDVEEIWIPRSLISDYSGFEAYEDLDEGDAVLLEIPEWAALERNLI